MHVTAVTACMLLSNQKEAAAPEVAAPVIWPGILPGIIDARYRCHRVYAAIQSKGSRACPARLYHTGMAAS